MLPDAATPSSGPSSTAPAAPPSAPATAVRERGGLVDLLVGPLTVTSVLAQVLTGLVVGGLVFGTAGGLLLLGDRAEQADERTAVVVTGGSIGRVQAQAVADELGWTVTRTVYDQAGIGSESPSGAPPITAQVRSDAEVKRADVVVVQGGEADTRMAPGSLEIAALHLIDWLRANVTPGTEIVLAGPVPGSEQSPRDLQGVDGVLRDAAAERDLPYLSALQTDLSRTDPAFGQKLVAQLRRLAADDE